jgi:hypothetical protein
MHQCNVSEVPKPSHPDGIRTDDLNTTTMQPRHAGIVNHIIWISSNQTSFLSNYLGPMLWFLKYWRFWLKTKLIKKMIITLIFEKNASFFAEKCDHNIGPWYAGNEVVHQKELNQNPAGVRSHDPGVYDTTWPPSQGKRFFSGSKICRHTVKDFFLKKNILTTFIAHNFTQGQCILSFDNGTAIYAKA